MLFRSSEDCIHYGLEGHWGVGQAEEHDSGFIKALICDESHFPLVACLDMDIVITPPNVELREEGRSFHLIDEFWDEW